MKTYFTSYTATRNAAMVSTVAMALGLNIHEMAGLVWLTIAVHVTMPLSAVLWSAVIARRHPEDRHRNDQPTPGWRDLQQRRAMNIAVIGTASMCYALTLIGVASIVDMTGGTPNVVQTLNWVAIGGICLMAAGSLALGWLALRLALAPCTQATP